MRRPSRPPFVRQVFAAASTCRHLESVRRFARDREVGHLRLCQRFPAVSVLWRVLTFGRRDPGSGVLLRASLPFPLLSLRASFIFLQEYKSRSAAHAVRGCAVRSPRRGRTRTLESDFRGAREGRAPAPSSPSLPSATALVAEGRGGGSAGRAFLLGSLGWWAQTPSFSRTF